MPSFKIFFFIDLIVLSLVRSWESERSPRESEGQTGRIRESCMYYEIPNSTLSAFGATL